MIGSCRPPAPCWPCRDMLSQQSVTARLCRPRPFHSLPGGRFSRWTHLLPAPAKRKAGSEETWRLHQDLLKQIEERKRLQEEIGARIQQAEQQQQTQPPAAPPQRDDSAQREAAERERQRTEQERLRQHREWERAQALAAAPAQVEPPAPARPEQPHWEQNDFSNKPCPAGENAMNVVMVGAECAPWSKTGGLGDVMGALPKALARRGHRVMVVAPRYSNYEEGWETGVRVQLSVGGSTVEVGYFHGYIDGVDFVFVDHPAFHYVADSIYGGDRQAITWRCALLCKAALEAVWHVPCGGAIYGDDNLVFVANDWHTALLPVYLQAHYRDYGKMTYARSVFIIHNIAHQGRGPLAELSGLEVPDQYGDLFYLDDPIGGVCMNVFKAGMILAHRIVAVSHGYAWECQTQEGGWGLDSVLREQSWKLRGIVNGIDYSEWSPQADKFLRSDGYSNYDFDSLREGKAACKAALQRVQR